MNTIEIRPFFQESAQNRNQFNIIDGKKVGTTKAPGGKFIFFIPDNGRTKRLAIDLSYKVTNPWFGKKASLPSNWINHEIDKQEEITKQQELEIKYNQPMGFLDNHCFDAFDVDAKHLKNKARTYLQSFFHIFEDQKNTLVLDNLHDEVAYEAIKNSKLFALSYEDALLKANTVRFYVSHLEQEAEEKANRNRVRMRTLGNLRDLVESHPGSLEKVALVLQQIRGKVATEVIENLLYDFIESNEDRNYNGTTKSERGRRFNDIFKLVTSKKKEDKERFAIMVLAQELLNARVVTENLGQYIWHTKRGTSLETIARSYESYLSFLQDPQNYELVEELKEEIKTTI